MCNCSIRYMENALGQCESSQQVCTATTPSTGSLPLPCTNGTVGCIDSSTIAICTNGVWTASASCGAGTVCSDGSCQAPAVAPGAEVCCPPMDGSPPDPLYSSTASYAVCPGGAMGCTCCPIERVIVTNNQCASCCASNQLAAQSSTGAVACCNSIDTAQSICKDGTCNSINGWPVCCTGDPSLPVPLVGEPQSPAVICDGSCCPQTHCKNGGTIGAGGNGGTLCCPNANDEVYANPDSNSPSGYTYACCNSGAGGAQELTSVGTGTNDVTLSVCCTKPVTEVCPINNLCCDGSCYVTDSSTQPAVGVPSDYGCCAPGNAVCDSGASGYGYYDSSLTFQDPGLNTQSCCNVGESCMPTNAGSQTICCPTGGQVCSYGTGGTVGYAGGSVTNGLGACCASPNQCLRVSDSGGGIEVKDSMCCPAGATSVCNTHYRLGGKYSDMGGFYDYSCCAGYCKDTKDTIAAELCCKNTDDVAGKTQGGKDWICCDSATYNWADTETNGILCCEKPRVPVYDNARKTWSCQLPVCPPHQTLMPDGSCCPDGSVVINTTDNQPLFCCLGYTVTNNLCPHCPGIPKDYCDYGSGCNSDEYCGDPNDGSGRCDCLSIPADTCTLKWTTDIPPVYSCSDTDWSGAITCPSGKSCYPTQGVNANTNCYCQ